MLGYLYGGAGAQFCLPDCRGSFVRGHAADAAAQGHAGAGPLAPGSGATSIGVNYLIKFTGGVRMR